MTNSQQGPMLAEAINNRLALQRRMEMEGQAPPALPDQLPQPTPRFGKAFSPADRAMQQKMLIEILRARQMQQPQGSPQLTPVP